MNAAASLCRSCVFARPVEGRRGQTYLLCGNAAVGVKYPPQPVVRCSGYAPVQPAAPHPQQPDG